MNKIELEGNLLQIIEYYKNLQTSIQDLLVGVNLEGSQRVMLDDFLDFVGLDINEETRYAAYSRISNLTEDPLVLYLDNQGLSDELKIKKLDLSYRFVCDFYSEVQAVLISVIEAQSLVTPFYLEIFKGVANVGLAFNELFVPWRNTIVNGVNKDLENRFENDTNKIINYLNENNLFDLGHVGMHADRSYSALIIEDGEYVSKSYYDVFTVEIKTIADELVSFIYNLSNLEDEIYDAKYSYINYLTAIKDALLETETNNLVNMWSKVDEAWMQIKTPFQIGHPLEYYEDKYRKAVAPEWDLRIQNVVFESDVEPNIMSMYETLFEEFDKEKFKSSYEFSKSNINRVQFYLTSPVLYYSSEFTGLFSAQVVPNDEVVSKMHGKKIFAFPEMVLSNKKSAPFMKLESIIFDEILLENHRKNIFGNDEKFYKIYDILTIAHEYGHNLWLDTDTQYIMNKKTGIYKNIEEFKATTGGLVMYFLNENIALDLKKDLIIEHIYRSIGLMKYREVNETEPYYCEAIIHLNILFESGIIFVNKDKKIELNYNLETYERVKDIYITHYRKLINIYLNKMDAGVFLDDYTIKKDGYYLPKSENIKEFVEYYYDIYKKVGNEIDDSNDKNIYK